MNRFAGMPIIFDTSVLRHTDERLFRLSRHRSRRVHKKLVRRFGGEFRKVPAIMQVHGALYAHPALKAQIEAQIRAVA